MTEKTRSRAKGIAEGEKKRQKGKTDEGRQANSRQAKGVGDIGGTVKNKSRSHGSMGQNQVILKHLINHFLTSSGVKE